MSADNSPPPPLKRLSADLSSASRSKKIARRHFLPMIRAGGRRKQSQLRMVIDIRAAISIEAPAIGYQFQGGGQIIEAAPLSFIDAFSFTSKFDVRTTIIHRRILLSSGGRHWFWFAASRPKIKGRFVVMGNRVCERASRMCSRRQFHVQNKHRHHYDSDARHNDRRASSEIDKV